MIDWNVFVFSGSSLNVGSSPIYTHPPLLAPRPIGEYRIFAMDEPIFTGDNLVEVNNLLPQSTLPMQVESDTALSCPWSDISNC